MKRFKVSMHQPNTGLDACKHFTTVTLPNTGHGPRAQSNVFGCTGRPQLVPPTEQASVDKVGASNDSTTPDKVSTERERLMGLTPIRRPLVPVFSVVVLVIRSVNRLLMLESIQAYLFNTPDSVNSA